MFKEGDKVRTATGQTGHAEIVGATRAVIALDDGTVATFDRSDLTVVTPLDDAFISQERADQAEIETHLVALRSALAAVEARAHASPGASVFVKDIVPALIDLIAFIPGAGLIGHALVPIAHKLAKAAGVE